MNKSMVFREMLRSKIAYATVTQTELYYEGSITLDEDMMKAAQLKEYEKDDVLNLNNGERLQTYVIRGLPGSGVVCLNGPAARKGSVSDKLVLISYAQCSAEAIDGWSSLFVKLDERNRVTSVERKNPSA